MKSINRLLKKWMCTVLVALMLLVPHLARADIEARFIDVGQGDACLIMCDGEAMLIDGGDASQSSKMVAILRRMDIEEIKYIINTHPHFDHLGGLNGPMNTATVEHVYSCVTEYDSETFASFKRFAIAQGAEVKTLGYGDILTVGKAEIYVLGPFEIGENMNNNSIIMRIAYGDRSMLLMGDAEYEEEMSLVNSGADISSDVLKVGHHGSSTSTSEMLLQLVRPQYAVVSVGSDNKYGHPHEQTLAALVAVGAEILRTDRMGDIVFRSDGENLTVEYESALRITETEAPTVEYYIGNVNSLKFHTPYCSSLPAEKNRVVFDTRDEAIDAGYSPCGGCKP